MDNNIQENRIDITDSKIPIIRVGFSNLCIFLLIVSVWFLNEILDSISVSKYLKILIIVSHCILLIKFYSLSISSIQKTQNEELIIVKAFSRSKIELSDVKWTKIYTIPASKAMLFLIKKRSAIFPNLFHFSAFQTNHGGFKDTYIKLSSLLAIPSSLD